jgi:putative endopeptidase
MDSARVEQLGITPLEGELAAIAKLQSAKDLPATFAHFARLGLQNLFSVDVDQDPKASAVNIVQVGQSGLGLPDRDYYLRKDAAITKTCHATVGSRQEPRPQSLVQQDDGRRARGRHAVI